MGHVLHPSEMRRVSPAELESLAGCYREAIADAAEAQGRETKLYLHWSAGHYGQFYRDGEIYVIADGALDDVLAATWQRNSGSVSICLLGCAGATTNNLGQESPTPLQIEGMAKAIAALSNGLWLTIDKQRVLTHGEAADNEDGICPHDPYGPKSTCERWDLEYLGTLESPTFHPWAEDGGRGGDVLRGKANWYRKAWEAQGGTPDD